MRPPVPFSPPPLPVPSSAVVRDDVQLDAIAPGAWNALTEGQPFLSHAFLTLLHATGCASRSTGWQPRYITAWRDGTLVGALPLYAKTHSYGEYVFDWGWADAYRRHGRRYYPKLVSAIPFTPVPGPRLLAQDPLTRRALLDAALAPVHSGRYSSLHVLFLGAGEAAEGVAAGMIARQGLQFHWTNHGYADFDSFLAALSHDKRKKIRQERRKVRDAGMTFTRKTGTAITSADWSLFFRCYEGTYRAHHSTPYLSRTFFERLSAAMPDNVLLVVGARHGTPICAALDVYTADTLWGRYWGTLDYVSGLHFEVCYYQAIDFCIEHGIERFEGGAQGAHKLARGLLPVTTHSLHAIGDPAFADAIADYCARERVDVAHAVDELEESSPFRDAGK
ncbi:MAG TPA: GNAT family N-acetyltransferase [Casimicrobiaceae bacterium]|nr:GNAT family N-acetyltransferase [Casimicrobiaceae bacterium]